MAEKLVILSSQSGKILKIAHGGALDPSQVNSLQGIWDSITRGVDAVEVDVQTTRDGEPVLFHDRSLLVNGRLIPISDLSLSDLAVISPPGKPHGIPLLRDVLNTLRETSTMILLDIKTPEGIDKVVQLIQDAKATEKTLIASFDFGPVTRAKEICPRIPTVITIGFSRSMFSPLGFLWTLFALLFPLQAAYRVNANAILCPLYRLTKRLIRKAHERKIAVFVWKLADQTKTSYLIALAVDGVVIDHQ